MTQHGPCRCSTEEARDDRDDRRPPIETRDGRRRRPRPLDLACRAEGAGRLRRRARRSSWRLGGPWLLAIPLLLVPDAVGDRLPARPAASGRSTYNLVHDWATRCSSSLGLGCAGRASRPLALAGAILIAHVGMDRAAGYGLKLPTSFQDTHLGLIGKARAAAQS